MSLRSLGAKVLNHTKIFINTQSPVSQHVFEPSDNEDHNPQIEENSNHDAMKTPRSWIKRPNSGRKKKRQRMHFRPIIPEHYICPITHELMTDPVIISSGHTFERTAICEWFANGNTLNPLTGQSLQNVDIKPNYALKEAIKEYRRKLADELFRITFDEEKQQEILYYRHNILFSKDDSKSEDDEDETLMNDETEYDGYLSDDEEDTSAHEWCIIEDHNHKCNKKRKRKRHNKNTDHRNIPIIAFLGPNSTGKSTLLNLIVGEPVFVTIDELSDYDTLSKVVRFKIVTRADREFILLDVEGLFPNTQSNADSAIDDAVLKVFLAVYSISSVIVWNDTDEHSPLLKQLLHRVEVSMRDLNRDGSHLFGPHTMEDMNDFADTPSGGLLPQELRQFLLKKYKKLTKAQGKPGGVKIGSGYTHKPAFIVLRRDFTNEVSTATALVEDTTVKNHHPQHRYVPPRHDRLRYESHTDSASSPSPRLRPKEISSSSHLYTVHMPLSGVSYTTTSSHSSGNDLPLSIVDENKEQMKDELSDSSGVVVMDDMTHSHIVFGNIKQQKKRSNSVVFSEYLRKHDDFKWLRQLDLFCFVDGVVLHKLDDTQCDEYQDDSLLSVLPKVECWIQNWCRWTQDVIPIVRNNQDMWSVVQMINKYDRLSCVKYVEECIQIKGSRIHRYFYYDAKERTLDELKLIAERFKWDNKNVIQWFMKHFNRLWYHIRDFPNAHEALVYHSLFYQYHLNNCNEKAPPIVPTIILNLSQFYYQISNKVDLYRDIVDKSAGFGQFAGAVGGLSSLSLMSVIHPLVGIAAVPLSIHLASSLGANSGAKVGDLVANSKAHLIDKTERYDLGKIEDDKCDNIVYHSCYDSDGP